MHVHVCVSVHACTCICFCFIVPTPFVQITIFDNEALYFDNETLGNYTVGNLTIGDPLTLDCTVTAVRGISSSVDIIWTTGGRVVRRVDNITADIENDYAIYTDSFEISSLSAIDNGREYQCTVVINANLPVNSSDQLTLIFPGEHTYDVVLVVCKISLNHQYKYLCQNIFPVAIF